MKNKEENQFDHELSDFFNAEHKTLKSSSNFTHQVMQKVAQTQVKQGITQLPIFGLVGWLVTGVLLLTIALALIFVPVDLEWTTPSIAFDLENYFSEIKLAGMILFSIICLIVIDNFLRKRTKSA